jgi:pimeloyl-ACP methyl ester carboxylesterase
VTRFLLVHGSGHGAWCWRDVIPALEALGHDAVAFDLPGSGADPTPPEAVTLDGYARAILAHIDGPAVVVGHSAGGFPIRQAAEIDPANITRLVFLCGYVPRPGMSLVDMRREAPDQPLAGALELDETRRAYRFSNRAVAENLCADCPPEALDFARHNLGWQAITPQSTTVAFTGKSATVPQSYILCEHDRTIPPAHQRIMSAGFAPEDIHTFPTGHSPFLVAPEALAALLHRIART